MALSRGGRAAYSASSPHFHDISMERMENKGSLRDRAAPAVIRIVGVWILAVALIKLFKGTPSDLPGLVRDFWPSLDLALKLKLAIAIELATAALALLAPRFGWLLQVPMLTLFVGMLVVMTAQGAESCGCFGAALKVPPPVMLAVDGACLAAILWTRPWRLLRAPQPSAVVRNAVLGGALAVAIASPFLVIRAEAPQVAVRDESGAWQAPAQLPDFAVLEPRKWVGQAIGDTELGVWVDTDQFPLDATWILYRINCPHCAKELKDLAEKYDGQTVYVLVRIPEENDEAGREVHVLPPVAAEATLPALPRGYAVQTPWMLVLEGGVVASAHAGEGVDDSETPAK
jgi:hypothetical protein